MDAIIVLLKKEKEFRRKIGKNYWGGNFEKKEDNFRKG